MTDDTLDPWRRLEAIIDAYRVGEVDGVKFDLRHHSIPPDVWHAPGAAYSGDVSYPWMRDTAPRAGAASNDDEDDFPRSLAAPTDPLVRIESGDAVSIKWIVDFDRREGPFVDPHDTEERWAYLLLKRADGTTMKLENPICFVPRDAMGPHSPQLSVLSLVRLGSRRRRAPCFERPRRPQRWRTGFARSKAAAQEQSKFE